MIDKQSIILGFHRYGKSKKQLSRDLGISLKNVKRHLKIHQSEMEQAGQAPDVLPVQGIIQSPRYNSSSRVKPVLTQLTAAAIDEYLVLNQKRKTQGKHKQLMKNTDIHEALKKADHQIGYRSVCRYVRQHKTKSKEVFIRQQYDPGQAVKYGL